MSTYWGFACASHTPPIVSERWLNHGEGRLYFLLAGRSLLGQDGDDYDPPQGDLYAATIWLREHPRCHVVIRSEYGDVIDKRAHCQSCTCRPRPEFYGKPPRSFSHTWEPRPTEASGGVA